MIGDYHQGFNVRSWPFQSNTMPCNGMHTYSVALAESKPVPRKIQSQNPCIPEKQGTSASWYYAVCSVRIYNWLCYTPWRSLWYTTCRSSLQIEIGFLGESQVHRWLSKSPAHSIPLVFQLSRDSDRRSVSDTQIIHVIHSWNTASWSGTFIFR